MDFFLLDENQDKDRKDDDNSRRMTAEWLGDF